MTNQLVSPRRIPEIDVLRGIVMIIMALDHVRTFFGSTGFDPLDLDNTDSALFMTRWITHFCAPVFVFLAGTSAYLYQNHMNHSKKQLSRFLFTRGLWIIFIEIFIWNLIIQGLPYTFLFLQVLWAIGWSMCVLSVMIYLSPKYILILALTIVFGHNLLDGIKAENLGEFEWIWAFLHQKHWIDIGGLSVSFWYPVLPWIGVIAMGYVFGAVVLLPEKKQRKWLIWIGIIVSGLFVFIRLLNTYGDPHLWVVYPGGVLNTVFSFLNTEKYPPSMLFILMTLGPSVLLLPFLKQLPEKVTNWLMVFGKVPMFYYLLHFIVIQFAFIFWAKLNFNNSANWFLGEPSGFPSEYKPSLTMVYFIWLSLIIVLYPICRWYMRYKKRNKHYWWLSYL